MSPNKRNKINKVFLTLFLVLAMSTWISKLLIGILYDFNYFSGSFKIGWWIPYVFKGQIPVDQTLINALNRRPQFLWMFTQFTWLTATMMIFFLMFRFFAFDERVPKWLRWIRSQRTLSIIIIFELVVLIIFWIGISTMELKIAFNPLKTWEIFTTISVHAVLPLLFTIYGTIFLVKDHKASLLREDFVLKCMIWPLFYSVYYLIVSLTWHDPYPLSNFINDFWGSFGKMIGALFCIYALMGLMMIGHNFILLRFNKLYDPTRDNDAINYREDTIAKIAKKANRKFLLDNQKFQQQWNKVNQELLILEKNQTNENSLNNFKKRI